MTIPTPCRTCLWLRVTRGSFHPRDCIMARGSTDIDDDGLLAGCDGHVEYFSDTHCLVVVDMENVEVCE